MMRQIVAATLFLVALSGCVHPARIENFRYGYENASYEDEFVSANIKYYNCASDTFGFEYKYGCEGYTLTVSNKTKSDIFLDWNKTQFIVADQANGGFYHEGVVFVERNQIRPDLVIFGKSTLVKNIWPNVLVSYKGLRWEKSYIPDNPNGVYLVLRTQNGTERKIKLTATVKYEGQK